MKEITFNKSLTRVRTDGLIEFGQQEIQVEVNAEDLQTYAEEFLRSVVNYLKQSGKMILAGETFPYGYWLVKFQPGEGSLDVWEYNVTATEFVYGASLTLAYWRDQHRICDCFRASFTPPRPDRLTVVDEGVLAGLPVQAVRYPPPAHMSGWWITTDKYNGISSLRTEHTYHITAVRPDVAPYLALPSGFRFNLDDGYREAWFDDYVAEDKSATS